jgi:hypothetical protein
MARRRAKIALSRRDEMKISITDVPRLTLAILRACATGLRLHETCTIRKCRRDGGCSGPMLHHDADTQRYVPARPSDDSRHCAPLCCLALDGPVRHEVAAIQKRLLQRIAGRPGQVFLEETRAIAARSWRAIAIADDGGAPASADSM